MLEVIGEYGARDCVIERCHLGDELQIELVQVHVLRVLAPENLWVRHVYLGWVESSRPNESRLSCGAPKKDSFHNLRAPPASSACQTAQRTPGSFKPLLGSSLLALVLGGRVADGSTAHVTPARIRCGSGRRPAETGQEPLLAEVFLPATRSVPFRSLPRSNACGPPKRAEDRG